QMSYWIKSIGATRSPLDDEWLTEENIGVGGLSSSPRLAERVHFPLKKRPSSIVIGDRFLLYGITAIGGRIIGAGIFKSEVRKEDRKEELDLRGTQDVAEWPWRIDIEMLISAWHAEKGPTIEAIGWVPTDMSQHSHRHLTEQEYRDGVTALAGVALPPA
ncbi:MAG TPA: hypothetical protein VNM41_04850, partial [Solirubrobacterales bacterium]|nr:hypothetical protein [Solirubrobacterales bacterium]